MSEGPLLYDDGPEPLHTGTGRSRRGLLVAIFGGTVLLAVGAVVAMLVVRGTAEEQASEAAGVFVAALRQDDVETAYGLLCKAERARLQPEDVAGEYLRPGTPTVVESSDAGVEQHVEVRWADGGAETTTVLTVVSEQGAHVCGTASAG